jgi:hypothetical protein
MEDGRAILEDTPGEKQALNVQRQGGEGFAGGDF